MKIGILTITPNVGYGGMLQAFALKTTLLNLTNSEVEVIQYRPYYSPIYRFRYFLSNLKKILVFHQFSKLTPEGELSYKCSKVSLFQRKYLNFSKKVTPGKPFADYINETYDVVVVGSDQVWRPKYVSSIYDFFFRGVNTDIVKMSYAASLGVDKWEFNTQETETCRRLLHDFSYVSVRERSAVDLIRQNMKYEGAIHWDIDPTLLLQAEDYKKLFMPRVNDHSYVFSYILDKNDDKLLVLKSIVEELNKDVLQFSTNGENSKLPLKDRVAPPVEDWLSGIYYSDFVVTDSFHGCVFAIIFNKPFFVYANKERGADRFISILEELGLRNRMIFEPEQYNCKTLLEPIIWERINTILKSKRQMTLDNIKEALLLTRN